MEGLLLFAAAMLAAVWVTLRPEWGAPFFASLIYLRLSDALRGEFGVPSLFKIIAPWLLLAALGRWLWSGARPGPGWRPAAWLMCAYGAVCIGSLLFAMDREGTVEELMNYADGVVIALVVALYLRTPIDLDRTLWAVLLSGALLASLSVFQQLSGRFDESFLGLARVELRNIYDASSGFRSEGPLEANYFGLILVVVVPLAVDRLLYEGRLSVRLLAAGALASVLGAVVCTYSRGSIVALAVVCIPMTICLPSRRTRRRMLAGAAAGIGLAAVLTPAGYGERLAALGQLFGAASGSAPQDGALRGRLSEVTSAAMMFADHPVIGVGYGNFEGHYHRYARELALDGRREERQAHSLYLEVAAETGVVGMLAFSVLLAYPIVSLRRAHQSMRHDGRTRDAQRVAAFAIGLFGYLVGSLFLHLTFPRYFWLLLGMAIAVGAMTEPRGVPEKDHSGEPQCA